MFEAVFHWPGENMSVDSMFLMESPVVIVIVIVAYLFFALILGPSLMITRKPMRIRFAIIPYNILQIVSSILLIYEFHIYGFSFENTWKCVPNDDVDASVDMEGIHQITWFLMVLRIFELSETFFFVLRKKKCQITYLHLYHHVSSILIFWLFFKYSGGIMEVFFIVVSLIAHIIKYFYYLLSSYTNVTKLFLMLKFIKPIIIILQLFELLLFLCHSLVAVSAECNLSPLFHLQIVNIIILFVLYAQFFIKNYMKRHNLKY